MMLRIPVFILALVACTFADPAIPPSQTTRAEAMATAEAYRTFKWVPTMANVTGLKPGDILNAPNSHVFLFKEWTKPDHSRMLVYTTGTPPAWAVQIGPLRTRQMAPLGYTAWRYRGMRD